MSRSKQVSSTFATMTFQVFRSLLHRAAQVFLQDSKRRHLKKGSEQWSKYLAAHDLDSLGELTDADSIETDSSNNSLFASHDGLTASRVHCSVSLGLGITR